MKKLMTIALVAAAAWAAVAPTSEAAGFRLRRSNNFQPWHAGYYDPQWAGTPHAMVVPPTTRWQFKYSWGVSGTELHRISPKYHSGSMGDPVGGVGGVGQYAPQPVQPSHTDQMGTYYIRMPRD